MWELLHLQLCPGGQGDQVHHDHRRGHHQRGSELQDLPSDLLHHLQEVTVTPAICGQDGVGVPEQDVPAQGQHDGDRWQDWAQPGESCRGPLQWPRTQSVRHVVTILEKVWNRDPMFLTVREEFWIKKMNTKHKGMNRNRGG